VQCSKCKTVITKGVMIRDTGFPHDDYEDPAELYYCKECFKMEFMGEWKPTTSLQYHMSVDANIT